MRVNGRWRWLPASTVALCSAGLLALTVLSPRARARPVSAHVAGCSGESNGGSFFTYGGGRVVSQLDVPVCATGVLTVTFAGDPAAGCATEGLCDYSGTETFAPDGGGDLSLVTSVHHGRQTTSGSLFLGGEGSPLTSAVQRTVSTGMTTASAACSDTAGDTDGFGVFFTLKATRGRMAIDLADAQQPMLGSRCAGPLDVDVASALSSRSVALHALEHGKTAIDLTGGGPFAAHGLSGTVTSTIVLTLGRPQREHERRTTGTPGRGHVQIARTATTGYRIAQLTGRAVVAVRSSATPAACGPYDACGLGGTITVLPGASARGSASLDALNTRATRRELLAELHGAGPPSTKLIGGGAAEVRGAVHADLAQGGGTCSDSVALHQFSIRLAGVGRRLRVTLAPSESQAADPLRTRCPGPDLGSHMLAGATVPSSVLRHSAFTVALRGLAFSDGPYRVTTRSTFTLTLRRTVTRVRTTHIVTVRAGGSSSAVVADR